MSDKPVDVWDAVQADMKERQQVGLARYGKPVTPDAAENWLQHQYEELLDAAVYCKAGILRRAGARPAWTPADIPKPNLLRFELWDGGHVVVHPWSVVSVVESLSKVLPPNGRAACISTIRLGDGKEYTVRDPARSVTMDIWLARDRFYT